MADRCWHPLGWSEAVAVTCGLPPGHDGPHMSSFDKRLRRELRYCEYEPWLLGWCRWRLELRWVFGDGAALTQTLAEGRWKWRGRDARLHEHAFLIEKSDSFAYDPMSAEMYPINVGSQRTVGGS